MADFSVNHTRHRAARFDRLEYRIYFGLIFAFALLFALVGHVVAVVRDAQTPAIGPVAKARAEAHHFATLIFRG